MRKRRGQNRGKINIRSIVRTGVAYKKKRREKNRKRGRIETKSKKGNINRTEREYEGNRKERKKETQNRKYH